MSGFADNLITRHTGISNKITPRLPGIFEPVRLPTQNLSRIDFANTEIETGNDPITAQSSGQSRKIPVPLDEEKTHGVSISAEKRKEFEEQESGTINVRSEGRKLNVENTNLFPNEMVNEPPRDEDAAKSTNIFFTANELKMSGRTSEIPGEGQRRNDIQISKDSIFKEKELPFANRMNVMFGKQDVPSPLSSDMPFNEQLSNSTSVIKISIGRIEVRAVSSPVVKQHNDAKTQKPKMSLEDYLAKRNNNKS